jgi:diaminohydroxyphosphoribosylaminopyrimidine deaminase/5-amino-6-(5-phosphoribosylamino)uracil reductase
VLVNNEKIIAEGFTQPAGQAHAEINALNNAADINAVKGATAYVTLEPCNHTGRTGPCVQALIKAGIANVVIACTDPNPEASGGIAALEKAGVTVTTGIMQKEARALNAGFFKRIETGLPFVQLKMASSLDGRSAMASGESQWITGGAARANVQLLRAKICAIITGIGTVLQDNPSLTVRLTENDRQPLKVIVDTQLRCSPSAKIFERGKVLIATTANNPSAERALVEAGAEIVHLTAGWGGVSLPALLKVLAQRGCNHVMVEAGAQLAGAFVKQKLADQITLYMAPTLLGSNARPMVHLPIDTMAEQQRLNIKSIIPVGNDYRIDATLAIEEIQ